MMSDNAKKLLFELGVVIWEMNFIFTSRLHKKHPVYELYLELLEELYLKNDFSKYLKKVKNEDQKNAFWLHEKCCFGFTKKV